MKGIGPHPENKIQHRDFSQDSYMVISSVEKQHSDWSRIVDKKEKELRKAGGKEALSMVETRSKAV